MDKEVEVVVNQFDSVLKDLTFNSRPIITTLTKMAEENISCAKYFVELLETRIDKCVPSQKLYAFYALDSICKNAGSPYTIFFSKNLFKLYKKTYLIVNNQVRTKLINLFKSWLQPTKSTGEPVFDTTTLNVIESFLVKASALHQKNFESKLPTPTIPLLLKEIDKLTNLTNERLKILTTNNNNIPPLNNQDYSKLLTKIEVLNQLKQVLTKEKLSPNALKQVQLQLKQVFAQDQHYLQERFRLQQQQELQLQQQQQQQQQWEEREQLQQTQFNNDHLNLESPSKSGTPIIPLFNNNNDTLTNNSSNNTLMGFSSLFGSSGQNQSNQGSNSSTPIIPTNLSDLGKQRRLTSIQNLYDSLNEENLLYIPKKNSIITLFDKLNDNKSLDGADNRNNNNDNNGSNINAGTAKINANLPPIPTLVNILNDFNAIMTVNNINLNNVPNLQLNQQNITSNDTSMMVLNNFIHLLYRGKPNKCSTCGKRFGNTTNEKYLQGFHLDWHFRINKRIKGSSYNNTENDAQSFTATQRNIQSRNWYIPDSEWIEFKDDEIVSTRFNKNMDEPGDDYERNNKKRNTGEMSSGRRKRRVNDNLRSPEKVDVHNSYDNEVPLNNITDISEQYVVVPETAIDNFYRCPICQEKVTSVYNDDTGEWIWKNTIQADGKYFHATCYKETRNI